MKTDRQLQQDVSAELGWEPSVHAARIGVEVKDGIVTLAGRVDSYAEKWTAERTAQRVSGVNALATRLKVQLPGFSKRTDADIASAVQHVLAWTAELPAGALQVRVEGGHVTLSGLVDWHYQKQQATDSVRRLMGVLGLSDEIGIQPSVLVTVIKSDIEAALKRVAILDAGKIAVAVQNAEITLTGTVRNWAERETALGAAWATPGVHKVVDLMKLVH